MNKKIRNDGQAMVELCLVLPLLLLIFLGGIVDFGYVFYNYITLQQLCNDTAMFAASPYVPITPDNASGTSDIGQSDQAVKDFVAAHKPPAWEMTEGSSTTHNKLTVTLPPIYKTSDGLANIRRVTLFYRSPFITPFWQTIAKVTNWKEGIPLTTSVAFQIPRNLWGSY
ncbi:MAG TPA: TadE/TadG family type IV pilus assembly protein [Candidatus Ozemobacteraceae bacterium]|nr:TadE/TadG family type IV pilus assembly protein [Candidatus Ozemobacteraceae bacterium]